MGERVGSYVGIGRGWIGIRVGRLVRGSGLLVGAFVLAPVEEGNGAASVCKGDGGSVFGLVVVGGEVVGLDVDGGGVLGLEDG